MEYEDPVYRPPGEWRSLLVQATIGCSHNQCTFCGMYKGKTFRIRGTEEVLAEIREEAARYDQYEKIFLCDGDAIAIPNDDLVRILTELRRCFPAARLISTYAGPRSTLHKTPEELRLLHEAGLGRAYLGIETGDGDLLKAVRKGVDVGQMLEAGLRLRQAGIDLWGIVLIGLGGRAGSDRNAEKTAELVNRMAPNHLSAMNYTPVPGTAMYEQVRAGQMEVLSAAESLLETQKLISGITIDNLHFTSDHASNYLPLKGTLKQDAPRLISMIDGALTGDVPIRGEFSRGL